MAARYWILGAGNWNDPLHWSATSGGVGGASVPTMDDDVYFDSNSGTGTVTVNAIANMRDCTFAQTQLITLTNAAYAFNIFGSWTLCSNTYLDTSFTGTGYVYLKATTSVNITSNGCTRAWNRLYFDGIGGEFVLIDNCILSAYLLRGTLNVNGNKLTGFIRNDGGSPTQSGLNLDNSSFEGSLFFNTTAELFFFSAINSIVDIISYCRAPKNTRFNIINYKSNSYNTADGNIDGLKYIDVLNIYSSSNTISVTYITNDFEVRLLNIFGTNSTNYRALFSSHFGTPRTITCNGTVTASNVDFRDIVGAGTANWDLSAITGGSGDCGGNSGITFTPAQTQYFKHTLGAVNWSDVTKWFSNYERTIQGRVPLPQDDAIFDENSFTGASTLNVNVPRIGGLNTERVNQIITISIANNIEFYKNFILNNTNLVTGIVYYKFYNRIETIIDTKNVAIPSVYFDFVINTAYYRIISNLYLSSVGVLGVGGYVYMPDITANIGGFNNQFICRELHIERAIINIRRNSYGNSILNVFPEDSIVNINMLNPSYIFFTYNENTNYNIINVLRSCKIDYGITVAELNISPNSNFNLGYNRNYNITKLTAIGTPEQPITIGSTTAGQRHTINYTGSEASTVEYCNISDSKVTQARRLLAKNSVNAGNNQNWGFEELPPLALNFGQVDKMYVGGSEVVSAYYGEVKIK